MEFVWSAQSFWFIFVTIHLFLIWAMFLYKGLNDFYVSKKLVIKDKGEL